MARIAGIDLPRNKRIEISLTYLYGVGRKTAQKVCKAADVDPATKTDHLNESEVIKLREAIERDFIVEGDLRRNISQNIKVLMDIGC